MNSQPDTLVGDTSALCRTVIILFITCVNIQYPSIFFEFLGFIYF